MSSRKIFKKSESINIYLYLLIIFLIIFTFFLYLINNKDFVVIPENNNNFYIIPKDRGGVKVDNIDKKSLNLKIKNIQNSNINKSESLFYTIQFYANNDFKKVNKYLANLINNTETIYIDKDFYILTLKTEIGPNYFLLYKNFESKDSAAYYCAKYLPSIKNCLIVDASKF